MESLKEEDTNVDPDGIPRNIPLIAMLAGKPKLLNTLQESVLLCQNNDMNMAVILTVARLIEKYILEGMSESSTHPVEVVAQELRNPNRSCPDDLDLAMSKHLNAVLEQRELSVRDASVKFGVS